MPGSHINKESSIFILLMSEAKLFLYIQTVGKDRAPMYRDIKNQSSYIL